MTIPKTWQEDYSNKLQKQVEELKAAHAAEQPKLTEEQAHAVVIDFWNKREMPQHPISSWESALVQFALLTSPVAPPQPASLVYEALVCAEYALTHPQSDQQFALKAIQSALTPAKQAIREHNYFYQNPLGNEKAGHYWCLCGWAGPDRASYWEHLAAAQPEQQKP